MEFIGGIDAYNAGPSMAKTRRKELVEFLKEVEDFFNQPLLSAELRVGLMGTKAKILHTLTMIDMRHPNLSEHNRDALMYAKLSPQVDPNDPKYAAIELKTLGESGNSDYAAVELEHLGDPIKKTGIYAPASASSLSPDEQWLIEHALSRIENIPGYAKTSRELRHKINGKRLQILEAEQNG
ncbi:hypothetical protein D3C74_49400 [compost metagenome]